jgi:hypothetical protein
MVGALTAVVVSRLTYDTFCNLDADVDELEERVSWIIFVFSIIFDDTNPTPKRSKMRYGQMRWPENGWSVVLPELPPRYENPALPCPRLMLGC